MLLEPLICLSHEPITWLTPKSSLCLRETHANTQEYSLSISLRWLQKHYPKCKKVWPKVGIAFYSTACKWIPSYFILYNYSEYTIRWALQYCFIARLLLKTQVLTENSLIEVFQIKSLKLYKVVKISCTSFNYDCKKLLTHEIISNHIPLIHITLSGAILEFMNVLLPLLHKVHLTENTSVLILN